MEPEDLPANPEDPATQAYRARIRARFAELHHEREQLEAQLKALARTRRRRQHQPAGPPPRSPETSCPRCPQRIKARLFAIFDVAIYWNKADRQVTVHAEITEATLRAAQGILDPTRDGYGDTNPDQPEPIGHLTNTPRWGTVSHPCARAGRAHVT